MSNLIYLSIFYICLRKMSVSNETFFTCSQTEANRGAETGQDCHQAGGEVPGSQLRHQTLQLCWSTLHTELFIYLASC